MPRGVRSLEVHHRLEVVAALAVLLLASQARANAPGLDLLPLFEPAARTEPGRVVRAASGGLLLTGAGSASCTIDVPAGARLVLDVARAGRVAWGDGFRLELGIEADGVPRRVAAARAFGGAPRSGASVHVVDLGPWAGRAARVDLMLDPGDGGSARGDACAVRRLQLELPGGEPVAALRALEAALPRFHRESSPRRGAGGPRPSVLLCLLDALRARDLSCYGGLPPTSPHLDRLARNGVTLAANFSQAPNTPPSVKALLTGRYLPTTGHSVLPETEVTVAETFAQAGYRTAAFSNTPFLGPLMGTHQGFADLDPAFYIARDDMYAPAPPPKRYAHRLAEAYRGWLGDGPSFAYLHAVHPHNPYAPIPPWDRLLGAPPAPPYDGTTATLMAIEHGRVPVDPAGVAVGHRVLYQEDLAVADHALGTIFAELRKRGRADATLVAVTSDHGEEFLEHGGILHGYTAYDEMLQVPALLAGPGLPQGAVVAGLTQSIDLVPTLLDVCGLPFPEGIQGMTLLPTMERHGSARSEVYASASSAPGVYSLRSERWKYVYAPGRTQGARGGDEPVDSAAAPAAKRSRLVRRTRVRGPGVGNVLSRRNEIAYLYDLDADALERDNVIDRRPILAELLHRRLLSWLDEVGGAGAAGSGTSQEDAAPGISQEECERLVALGYLEAAQCPCSCDRLKAHWAAFRDGTLTGPLREAVRDQLARCPECRSAFAAWPGPGGPAPPPRVP